jgi:hypothetical protein
MHERVDKQDLANISLVSAIELYKIQQKSGGLLSDPENIEQMLLLMDKKEFNINLSGNLLDICKIITMILLMDDKFIKSIVMRESNNQFEGLTKNDWECFQMLLEKDYPDFLK